MHFYLFYSLFNFMKKYYTFIQLLHTKPNMKILICWTLVIRMNLNWWQQTRRPDWWDTQSKKLLVLVLYTHHVMYLLVDWIPVSYDVIISHDHIASVLKLDHYCKSYPPFFFLFFFFLTLSVLVLNYYCFFLFTAISINSW